MSHPPRILFIDQNLRDFLYYSQRLQTALPDLIIFHATTGQSGLAFYQQEAVDCVVLDIELPDMSGFEVLSKLIPRALHPEIPVIILTGIFNKYLWEVAIKNGALCTFCKPLTSGDMLERAVLKAIATVSKDDKRSTDETLPSVCIRSSAEIVESLPANLNGMEGIRTPLKPKKHVCIFELGRENGMLIGHVVACRFCGTKL